MKVDTCFYVGYITKTKGLKGEVQLFFEYHAPEKLPLDVLFLELNGQLVPHFVTSHKLSTNQTGLFFFDDIDTIDKAESIVRKKAYLPNNKKPKLEKEAFSMKDLQGFLITDEHNGQLGLITEVHKYPKQFVASFLYQNKEVMLPLNDHLIKKIDMEKQIVHVRLPEGLLDVYLNQ